MEIDPSKLTIQERSALMVSVISPRPIAWVSTISREGVTNLAPFSFFTGISSNPVTVCFAPALNRFGEKKDTLVNIEATGQFVVNVATEETASAMNQTGAAYPRGVSEFEKAGLTPAPSSKVRPPGVRESPVRMECELIQVVTISEGPVGGKLVIGRVVHVHADDRIWKDGHISHKDLRPIGRMEGPWYVKATAAFEMQRPERPNLPQKA